MCGPKIVGIAGSHHRPSRTRWLVEDIARLAAATYRLDARVYDLTDVGPSLGQALKLQALDSVASDVVAEILVIGTPTYNGSYPGLFKHLIDLIEPDALRAKPVILCATGGGQRHTLMLEHQLRPLFGFLGTHILPTGIYATTADFENGHVHGEEINRRLHTTIGELGPFLGMINRRSKMVCGIHRAIRKGINSSPF